MTERNGSWASKGHGFSTKRGESQQWRASGWVWSTKKVKIVGLYSVERWEIVNYHLFFHLRFQ
jgi:hypothetical protein